jgi:hypothetical protein
MKRRQSERGSAGSDEMAAVGYRRRVEGREKWEVRVLAAITDKSFEASREALCVRLKVVELMSEHKDLILFPPFFDVETKAITV